MGLTCISALWSQANWTVWTGNGYCCQNTHVSDSRPQAPDFHTCVCFNHHPSFQSKLFNKSLPSIWAFSLQPKCLMLCHCQYTGISRLNSMCGALLHSWLAADLSALAGDLDVIIVPQRPFQFLCHLQHTVVFCSQTPQPLKAAGYRCLWNRHWIADFMHATKPRGLGRPSTVKTQQLASHYSFPWSKKLNILFLQFCNTYISSLFNHHHRI